MGKGQNKNLSPKAQMEFARRINLAEQLMSFSRPLIHMQFPSDIHVDGHGFIPGISSINKGDTVSLTSEFREMLKEYAFYDEPQKMSLKDLKINGIMNLGRGNFALITDAAVLCTLDLGPACRELIYGGRYQHKHHHVDKEDIRQVLSQHIQTAPTRMSNNDISIRQIVDQCLVESVPMIGISGSDYDAIQRVSSDGKITGVNIRSIREGDVIALGPQCIDQLTGESIDSYGSTTTVLSVCQIGKESLVLTEAGLITDADLSYQIELAMDGIACSSAEYDDLDMEEQTFTY